MLGCFDPGARGSRHAIEHNLAPELRVSPPITAPFWGIRSKLLQKSCFFCCAKPPPKSLSKTVGWASFVLQQGRIARPLMRFKSGIGPNSRQRQHEDPPSRPACECDALVSTTVTSTGPAPTTHERRAPFCTTVCLASMPTGSFAADLVAPHACEACCGRCALRVSLPQRPLADWSRGLSWGTPGNFFPLL